MDALSARDSSDDERLARFLLAHAILLSFPGVPAIYIQSIMGSRNDYDGVERLGYNRAINRQKYQQDDIENQLQNSGTLRHRVYHALARMVVIRRQNSVFHPDSGFTINTLTPQVMQITRRAKNGETLNALFNISNENQQIKIHHAGFDLISECPVSHAEITLRPWQVMWIKKQ